MAKARTYSTGDFSLRVVGTSHYQDTLRRVKGDEHRAYVAVLAVREPDNEHDPNAVQVITIGRETLGYLSRDDAIRFGPAIEQSEALGYYVKCQAVLYGGGGDRFIGAALDLAPPDEIAQAL